MNVGEMIETDRLASIGWRPAPRLAADDYPNLSALAREAIISLHSQDEARLALVELDGLRRIVAESLTTTARILTDLTRGDL